MSGGCCKTTLSSSFVWKLQHLIGGFCEFGTDESDLEHSDMSMCGNLAGGFWEGGKNESNFKSSGSPFSVVEYDLQCYFHYSLSGFQVPHCLKDLFFLNHAH